MGGHIIAINLLGSFFFHEDPLIAYHRNPQMILIYVMLRVGVLTASKLFTWDNKREPALACEGFTLKCLAVVNAVVALIYYPLYAKQANTYNDKFELVVQLLIVRGYSSPPRFVSTQVTLPKKGARCSSNLDCQQPSVLLNNTVCLADTRVTGTKFSAGSQYHCGWKSGRALGAVRVVADIGWTTAILSRRFVSSVLLDSHSKSR